MRRILEATSLATVVVLAALASPAGLTAQAAEPAAAPPQVEAVAPRSYPMSWTSDRRAYNVGDLITVIVDESTLAVQDRSNSASQERSSTLGLNGSLRTAASASGADAALRTSAGGSSTERGQARRQDRLTAELTVRVTAVEPGGVLRVEGAKSLVLDGREQKVTLAGLVRAADVSPQNAVDSWRIADVSIAYHTDGKLSQPKRSILMRVLGMVWP